LLSAIGPCLTKLFIEWTKWDWKWRRILMLWNWSISKCLITCCEKYNLTVQSEVQSRRPDMVLHRIRIENVIQLIVDFHLLIGYEIAKGSFSSHAPRWIPGFPKQPKHFDTCWLPANTDSFRWFSWSSPENVILNVFEQWQLKITFALS
jgi:hypothetical protein